MRRHRLLYAAVFGAFAAALACGKGGTEHLSGTDFPDDDAGGTVIDGESTAAQSGPVGSGLVTGLPCDVQAIVENRCAACHDGSRATAPLLLQYSDFLAPSKIDPTKTLAAMSLVRMKAAQMPPAPATPANADEIQAFSDWIDGGTQMGGICTDAPPDGGTDAGNVILDAGPDADGGPACASGVLWTKGESGDPLMHPGRACNACHASSRGPNLTFAGTVYAGGLHDVDDCNGSNQPPPLVVVITDKMGKTATLPVNAAGNFYLEAGKGPIGGGFGGGFKAPFRAKVVRGTATHAMQGSVTSGDCNSCHTSAGLHGAPGRILAP